MQLDSDDTIAAIASAPGAAARGIVRVAGANCVPVVSRIFEPQPDAPQLAELRVTTRVPGVVDAGTRLGKVSADLLVWPGKRSYTRQPSAEFHTFGSPPLLNAILVRLCEHGARIARPGEFTLRAFLAGRIDLTQAEAVLGVIEARDQRELSVALSQLAGGLAGPLNASRDRLLDLLAHLEAGLDFVEEDIEFVSPEMLLEQLGESMRQIDALADQMRSRGTTHLLPRVVICGLPNVGKSSLFNALSSSDSAIVSHIAGTTRDYVSRQIRCGNREIELIDTAGIDSASAAGGIDAAGQEIALDQAQQAALVLECREAIHPPPAEPRHKRSICVVTKCDQVAGEVPSDGAVRTSSRAGQGMDDLKRAIEAALAAESSDANVVTGTAVRCRESLLHAAEALRRARDCAAPLGEEFVAAEVRTALDELGCVVGAVYTDDVLDRIFSRFCIGK